MISRPSSSNEDDNPVSGTRPPTDRPAPIVGTPAGHPQGAGRGILRINRVYNNNLVLATDRGREVILVGRGLGFGRRKGDLIKPGEVHKRFELAGDVRGQGARGILIDLPLDVIELTAKVTDHLDTAHGVRLSDAAEIGLADHLHAAITRQTKGITLYNDLIWETKSSYRREFAIALEILDLLRREGHPLPLDEAGFITMHLVSAGVAGDMAERLKMATALREVVAIVERTIPSIVDTDSNHYLRFLTHLKFAIQRINDGKMLTGRLGHMFEEHRNSDPQGYACVLEIGDHLTEKFQIALTEEEQLYLLVHLARLRGRDD